MSRIVKSMAVVDDRDRKDNPAQARLEAELVNRKVLKGGVLKGFGFTFQQQGIPPTRDSALDELNRLRVQLEEAKEELRLQRQAIGDAKAEYEAFQNSREDADLLEDEVYQSRKTEIQTMLSDVQVQSIQILDQARKEAKEFLAEAKAEGYREGYLEGYGAAEEAFKQEAQPRMEELARLIEEISSYGEVLMQEKENEFVELVIAVAGKVLAREIKTDSKYILDMLHDYLVKHHRETYINLSVSPDMLPARVKASDSIIAKLKELAGNLTVYVEKEEGEGLLVLETPMGVTDMSLETQLGNIKETLLSQEE